MKLEPAREQQAEEIYRVVQQSIKTSYPQYYSAQVVDFFCALHNREAITEDILCGNVKVLMLRKSIVGTGSYKDNHITRVYILQEYQGRGYGRFIMHAIEEELMKKYHKVYLDASRPGIPFYEKLGYQTAKHEEYETADGVVLAYEVMEKLL